MRVAMLLCGAFLLSVGSAASQDKTYDKLDVMETLETMAKAYVKKDVATLEKVFHADLSYGHTDGHAETKSEVIGVARTRTTQSIDFSDVNVSITGSVALVRGVMLMKMGGDKPSVSNRGVLWVLVKGDGPSGWQILARQNWALPTKPGA